MAKKEEVPAAKKEDPATTKSEDPVTKTSADGTAAKKEDASNEAAAPTPDDKKVDAATKRMSTMSIKGGRRQPWHGSSQLTVSMFENKRLCERWLDNLFMVLYEVLTCARWLCLLSDLIPEPCVRTCVCACACV